MTPMIDVIFLLLTFFIYCQVVLKRVEILPVALTGLSTGEQPTEDLIQAITIDRDGQLFLNREPIDPATLDQRLAEMSRQPNPPTVYLALESQGSADRGPVLIDLIDRVRSAGIQRFVIVGQQPQPPTSTP